MPGVIGTDGVLSFEGEGEREGGYNKSGDGMNSLRMLSFFQGVLLV
jgi:hypothetical protein